MDFEKIEEGYADGEKPLHFYYNREERLANAPKIVQDYYAGKGPVFTKNVFKFMFSNPLNRFMFIFLLMFCAFAYFVSYQHSKNLLKIAGTSASVSAFSYAEDVYATVMFEEIKSKGKNEAAVPLPVHVEFSAVNAEGISCALQSVDEVFSGERLFVRTKFADYDIIKIVADVVVGDENKSFTANVVKR